VNRNPGTPQFLRSVWAVAPDDVWVVGDAGTALHYDGNQWTVEHTGVSAQLFAVTAAGGDVWAGGASGVLLRRTNGTWTPQQTGTSRTIRTLWANSATDVWAGGEAGLLMHYQP